MNNITLTGRIVRDFDLKTSEKGLDFVHFTIAVPSEFKDEDGNKKTDFFDCVAWRDNAKNIAKFFTKGKPIGVSGTMNCRTYTGKDGNKRKEWEVTVRNFTFEAEGEKLADAPKQEKTVGGFRNLNIDDIQVKPIDAEDLPF